jgi:hypothetical protein
VHAGTLRLVQAAQHTPPCRDDWPVPLCHEQPLSLRSLERLDPQPAAVDHEAKAAELERGPHFLDHIVDRQIAAVCLGQPDEDLVDGADGAISTTKFSTSGWLVCPSRL